MMPIRTLTIPEVADALRCSTDHVYDLINARKLAPTDIGVAGSKMRVSEKALAAFIEANTTPVRAGRRSRGGDAA